ncbi:MAG: RraA family protein [Candidatus Fimivivens sp.]
MSVGMRIFLKRKMPQPHQILALSQIPAANIADTMGRSCALNPRIKLMSNPTDQITAGPALTVKTRAGDNLVIHQTLDMAQAGDVIVVSNDGDTTRALMGEIMFTYAKYKKVGAIILDGPLRDFDAASAMDFPIYATGTTPGGPYKEGPGEINVPISCGGISVSPGDIMVMDSDGIIVVPRRDADPVIEAATRLEALDAAKVAAAANGMAKREWVLKTIQQKGFEIIDSSCEDA